MILDLISRLPLYDTLIPGAVHISHNKAKTTPLL